MAQAIARMAESGRAKVKEVGRILYIFLIGFQSIIRCFRSLHFFQ